jgi:WD40 repeat protein
LRAYAPAAAAATAWSVGPQDAASVLAVSAGGHRVCLGGDEGVVRVHDAETGALVRRLEGLTGSIEAIDISPDGTRVAVGTFDHQVAVWNVESGKFRWAAQPHASRCCAVRFSRDGASVWSAGWDGSIREAGTEGGEEIRRWSAGSWVAALATAPDGRRLASAQGDGTAMIWRVRE